MILPPPNPERVSINRGERLSHTRALILALILDSAGRRAPTFQELADRVGVWKSSAAKHVHALARAGLVTLGGPRQAVTVRPAVLWIPAHALAAESATQAERSPGA